MAVTEFPAAADPMEVFHEAPEEPMAAAPVAAEEALTPALTEAEETSATAIENITPYLQRQHLRSPWRIKAFHNCFNSIFVRFVYLYISVYLLLPTRKSDNLG